MFPKNPSVMRVERKRLCGLKKIFHNNHVARNRTLQFSDDIYMCPSRYLVQLCKIAKSLEETEAQEDSFLPEVIQLIGNMNLEFKKGIIVWEPSS